MTTYNMSESGPQGTGNCAGKKSPFFNPITPN
jgi:hypothetical protein